MWLDNLLIFWPVLGFVAAFVLLTRYGRALRSFLRSWLEAPHG